MRSDRMFGVLQAMRNAINDAKLSPDEALNISGEFLASVVASSVNTEQDAHLTLNSITESGHLFINTIWREVVLRKQQEDRRR